MVGPRVIQRLFVDECNEQLAKPVTVSEEAEPPFGSPAPECDKGAERYVLLVRCAPYLWIQTCPSDAKQVWREPSPKLRVGSFISHLYGREPT